MSTNEVKLRLSVDGAGQVKAGVDGAAQSLERLGSANKRVASGMQMNAQQAVQLSAQLQDLVVQIQAGQAPLTALLQQGSQLSYVFGGVGNAFRAVGSLITPMVAAIGAGVTAVGAIALAYNQGSKEQDAFARGLILTGNAAGSTVSRLNELAKAQDAVAGTRAQAAQVLAQIVASGQASEAVLSAAVQSAIALERAGGAAAEETAKKFEALGRSPLQAILKLNEAENFLTRSVYDQVRALEEQGRAADAAAVAQAAYADTLKSRSADLEERLGDIDRAWRWIKTSASEAWDAMLNVGRPETVDERLQSAQTELSNRMARGPLNDRPEVVASFEKGNAALRSRIELLRLQVYEEGEAAAAQAASAQSAKAYIAAQEDAARAAKRAAEDARRQAEAGRDLAQSLAMQEAGLSSGFLADWNKLLAAYRSSAIGAKELEAAQARLLAQQPAMVAGMRAAADAAQAAQRARQAEYQSAEDYLRQQREQQQRVATALRERAQGLETEAQAAELASSQNLSLAAAIEVVTIARMRERLERLTPDSAGAAALREEIALRERLLTLIRSKDTREANARAAADHAREWERINDQVGQSLADALMQGGRNAGEYLKSLFRTMVLRPILQAVISPVTGAVSALLYGGGTSGTGAAMAGVNNASTLANLYQAGTGYSRGVNALAGFMGAGTTAGASGASLAYANAVGMAGGDSLGALIAANNSWAGVSAGGSAATGASSSAGASAGASAWTAYAAAFVAAYMGSRDAWEKGFNNDNLSGAFKYSPESTFTDMLKSLGMSDRAANIWGGGAVYTSLFGRASPRIEQQGVMGTLRAGDFSGSAFADILEKGGLFRSDRRRTETAALPDELGRFLDDAAAAVMDQAKRFGAALGLPAEQLADVSTQIKVAFGEDAEKTKEEITKALGQYGDALVSAFADEVAPLAQYGETTAQTIARVGQAILSVNDVLDALGLEALALSVDGGKAAQALGAMFGGVEGLQQAAGGYLQGYYAQAERAELVTQALGKTMADLGLAMPATRDAFRELVGAQDLSTDAGRRTFAALMGVADAFAQVTRSADDIAAERAGLTKQLLQLQGDTTALRALERDALDGSNRALYDQIQALTDQQAAAQEAADSARTMADAAREAAQSMADAWSRLTDGMDDGVRSAFGAVSSLIDAERRKAESDAQSQVRELEAQAGRISSAWGGLIDGLGASLDSLRGLGSADGGRGAAMGTLRAASASLSAGQTIDLDAVRNAASQVATLGTDAYGSRLDYQRAIAGTQTLLRDVMAGARRQMTSELGAIAAAQVKVEARLAEQIKTLDQQLKEARSAAESLVRIDDGVQTVAEAIAALTSAIGAARAVRGDADAPAGQWLRNGGTEVWAAAGGAVGARPAGSTDPSELVIKGKQSTFTAGEARAWVNAAIIGGREGDIVMRALAEGIDSSALDALMEWAPGTALAEARKRGLPAFASGTAYVPSTGIALVHEGERILPAEDNAALMRMLRGDSGGGGSNSLIRELTAVVDSRMSDLMAGMHAVASNTGKLATLQDDVINGGASMATRAEA